MARRHYNLPPLTTLAAFEAAARHLSFKEAARELSVTPGAVSHQIKALEQDLGAALFVRRHRGVELTAQGQDLAAALSGAFRNVAQSLQRVRDQTGGNAVTVGSTSAVAALWLTPAITRFWREHPQINVTQVAQDKGLRNNPTLDLFIRYGRFDDSRWQQSELYTDHLVPVAGPDLARTLAAAGLEELATQRLIHLDSEDRTWTRWQDWFAQLGYRGPVASGIHVNNYAIALQAAQDGAGVALGWMRLVRPHLSAGHLVRVGTHRLPAPHSFQLFCAEADTLSAPARLLRDWLIEDTRKQSSELNSSVEQVFRH